MTRPIRSILVATLLAVGVSQTAIPVSQAAPARASEVHYVNQLHAMVPLMSKASSVMGQIMDHAGHANFTALTADATRLRSISQTALDRFQQMEPPTPRFRIFQPQAVASFRAFRQCAMHLQVGATQRNAAEMRQALRYMNQGRTTMNRAIALLNG
jgi:hypothetical protein